MSDDCFHSLCSGCCRSISRRDFIKGCGAAVGTVSGLSSITSWADEPKGKKGRVATVFLSNINIREIWPYPGYDTNSRRGEVLKVLRDGYPEIEFIPLVAEHPGDMQKLDALKNEVDGYLIYIMTLDWGQGQVITDIGKQGKPMLLVDEFLGGSGTFLTRYSALRRQDIPVAAVSSTRLSDLVKVVRAFNDLRNPGITPATFARQCEKLYRQTFTTDGTLTCAKDPITLTDIGTCLQRFQESNFLIVSRKNVGKEHDFLGTKGRYIDFSELKEFYDRVDRDQAGEWAEQWTRQATKLGTNNYIEPSQPTPEAIRNSGAVYLATRQLLEKYKTDTVTMDCLGGFAAGKLPAYPCLAFMQILNDGGQGVCEAMPNDTLSMLMARILTGRPGFVSDPALDTSKNQVVYAHCVGTTHVFGSEGKVNDYRIRTLHNRDPKGACTESLMPGGYMTTSFRVSRERKQLIIHQAKALGTLDSEHGCRTKLVAEVCGDIEKLFYHWDNFGWHRVTVYGDVKEPLKEFGKALGLEIIEEA
jgi:hypothetical protein